MIQRWRVAGWLCVALSVVLAVVSMLLAFRGGTGIVSYGGAQIQIVPGPFPSLQPNGLLRAVVFGVLAGVAFFTGLACFFWSVAIEARQQRAEIVRLLENRATPGASTSDQNGPGVPDDGA